jgi:hypothetical protein
MTKLDERLLPKEGARDRLNGSDSGVEGEGGFATLVDPESHAGDELP